jgi:hypothetical protein
MVQSLDRPDNRGRDCRLAVVDEIVGEQSANGSSIRETGLPIPTPRTADELLKDPEVIEDIETTGAVLREVEL